MSRGCAVFRCNLKRLLYIRLLYRLHFNSQNALFFKIIQNNGCLNKILTFCQEQNEEVELSPVNAAAARALAKSARKRKFKFGKKLF